MTPSAETGVDALWCRYALRRSSPVVRVPGQLGTRLGCSLPADRQSILGAYQSLRLAGCGTAVPQSAGADQGEEGKKPRPKHDPNHRTRPELALELVELVAKWFPDDEIMLSGDSALRWEKHSLETTSQGASHQSRPSQGMLDEPAPPRTTKTRGPARKKGKRLPALKQWAEDTTQPWTRLDFNQFGLHAALAVKTIKALYYKGV